MNNFKHRIIVPETIDDFNWSGQDLDKNLEEIEWINKNLGGTRTSAYPVLSYIQKNLKTDIRIVDIGCGSGDLLKKIQLACEGVKKIELIGLDANSNIIGFAKRKHFKEKKISFVHADIIREPELIPTADVYVMNLFLHHFEKSNIKIILNKLLSKNPRLIVVNDLERSKLAHWLFSLVCKIKNVSIITFKDGRLSILKGFNRNEMKEMASSLSGYKYALNWKWAFRWQLVISKRN